MVADDFAEQGSDAAWCRWLLCFVKDPAAVVARIGAALRPGGAAVFHEYIDYRSWRLAPRAPEQELFVDRVMASWRAEGGDPDVGTELPRLLVDAGFRIESTRLHTDAVAPADPLWEWPRRYVDVGAERLVELGQMSAAEATALTAAFERTEALAHARMILPLVIEVIARR